MLSVGFVIKIDHCLLLSQGMIFFSTCRWLMIVFIPKFVLYLLKLVYWTKLYFLMIAWKILSDRKTPQKAPCSFLELSDGFSVSFFLYVRLSKSLLILWTIIFQCIMNLWYYHSFELVKILCFNIKSYSGHLRCWLDLRLLYSISLYASFRSSLIKVKVLTANISIEPSRIFQNLKCL